MKLLLFGGKGGVGKTTLSAAAAISLAEARPSSRVLLLSTDPAHSLSDSLGVEVSDEMTPIPLKGGGGDLFARQLSAEKLAGRFRERHGEIMKTIAERGTYFDREDISGFFNLSLPGLDEVMAILEVSDLLARRMCDVLVLDTAPTGHTLRLLALPEHMRKWIHVMDLMLQKHRYMATAFTRKKYVKDRCDRFLEILGREIREVGALLRNVHLTRFVPVMNPEVMSFRETERLVESLEASKIPLREILVNRVVMNGECPLCRGERQRQLELLEGIKKRFSRYDLVLVERGREEVRGIGALSGVRLRGGESLRRERKGLAGDEAGVVSSGMLNMGGTPTLLQGKAAMGAHDSALFQSLVQAVASGLEVILVGGKGGVGKTTVAASVGLQLAKRFGDKTFLVFSTDPAHSLSDVFSMPIGDRISPVSANLSGYEINADELFERFKSGYREEIESLFDRFVGQGMDIAFDREVMTELISLAPPGLDEIMALDAVMDARVDGTCDVLVLDASPTGHLLRFLGMPTLVREWLKAYFTLLMKYNGSVKLTKTVERILVLSRHVRRIQALLKNREKTAFIGVTLLETMVLAETERLLDFVDRAGIHCRQLVVNRVMPETGCRVCASVRKREQAKMEAVCDRFPWLEVTGIPLQHDVWRELQGNPL